MGSLRYLPQLKCIYKMHPSGGAISTLLQLPVPYAYASTAGSGQTISIVTIIRVSIKFIKCQASTVKNSYIL